MGVGGRVRRASILATCTWFSALSAVAIVERCLAGEVKRVFRRPLASTGRTSLPCRSTEFGERP